MNKDIVKHILEIVLGVPVDSNLHKALSQNNLFSLGDMLFFPDEDYDDLEFVDGNNAKCKLKKGDAGEFKAFKAYVAYCNSIGQPIDDND